jgi:hypothetical protein
MLFTVVRLPLCRSCKAPAAIMARLSASPANSTREEREEEEEEPPAMASGAAEAPCTSVAQPGKPRRGGYMVRMPVIAQHTAMLYSGTHAICGAAVNRLLAQ